MPLRPCLPLDPEIAQSAARRVADGFASQSQPNFLFNAGGQPRPQSVEAPCSRALMETFTQAYAELGGAVAPVPPAESETGAATECCNRDEHRVQVVDPWERGIAEVSCCIRLEDGRELDVVTDADGWVELPEDYHGEVEILIEDQDFDVVESAPTFSSTQREELYDNAHKDEEAYVTGQMIAHI